MLYGKEACQLMSCAAGKWRRTDQEGKDESPDGELRIPDLNGNNTEHKHAYCKGY